VPPRDAVLIVSLVIGLAGGLIAGGRFTNLADVRLRLVGLLFLGLVIRYATQFALETGVPFLDLLRLPLFAAGYLCLLVGLWANREQPGLPLAFVGLLLNATAMVTNGGYMPVWEPSIVAAGLTPADVGTAFHRIVGAATGGGIPSDFLAQAGPLADLIPIPIPFLRNVASIGDVFLSTGLAFFLFAIIVRHPIELEEAALAALRRRLGEVTQGPGPTWPQVDLPPTPEPEIVETRIPATTPVGEGGLVSASALQRPQMLGGSSIGSEGSLGRARWIPLPAIPTFITRVRRHPYVRLALDGSFSALWTGQLISALGDRIHQIALAFVFIDATHSAIAVGAVFLVATLPNLLFGPIAGGLVDRWDHREVMIVSDLLRAGLVLLIPIAAVTNLLYAYPLVFLVTTVSIFFRPAKGAILPRIVAADDLVPANSALWVGETFADIVGYVIAGLFVALLRDQLPLAFWVDSVTYVASALLIASIAVAPATRAVASAAGAAAGAAGKGALRAIRGFGSEIREGYRFLRGDTVLLANTIQATAGQFMLGIFLVLTPIYAADVLQRGSISDREAYGFIEGAIGAGNLIGGFVIGLIGSRIPLGRMVIIGYVLTGLAVAILPLAASVPVAVGIAFGTGVGNLAFVIPSQTLFQRRTPPEMMGRVLGLRFSVVFGSMTLAMGVGGILGEQFGAGPVIGVFGLVTAVAGLAGLFVPAVRDA
jgi:DHA3 family macrolide efflux protein-like MFS transporter